MPALREHEQFFKKISNDSVVQRVIDTITASIIAGRLKPGDKIPTELEMSETLGVGRNSIREAIKILGYLGVVEIKRADGTYVCEGFSDSMIDPMTYGMILHRSNDYNSLMEVREMIEVGIVRLAMFKYSEEDLALLKERLDPLGEEIRKGIDNVDVAFEADDAFHDAVCAMGHNPISDRLNRIVRVLTHTMRYSSVRNMIGTGRGEELYAAHENIYRMLEEKNDSGINDLIRGTYFPEEADFNTADVPDDTDSETIAKSLRS